MKWEARGTGLLVVAKFLPGWALSLCPGELRAPPFTLPRETELDKIPLAKRKCDSRICALPVPMCLCRAALNEQGAERHLQRHLVSNKTFSWGMRGMEQGRADSSHRAQLH